MQRQRECSIGASGSALLRGCVTHDGLDVALGGHLLNVQQRYWRRLIASGALLPRICRFLAVGGLGTLVNTGALVILYHHLHLALVVASAMATELAIGHNFLWNNYWTFGRSGLSLHRFAKFNVASLGGQCIAIVSLWTLVRFVGVHYIVANMVGIGLALVWNFTISVRWTWAPES
jgi:dolichol-phosphate mannosyltransferase